MKLTVPEYANVYFELWRYLILHGGRGGAKTETTARILTAWGATKPLEIICAREFQASIEESVKETIEGAISECELEWFYDIQNNKIIGLNGTVFRFKGMARNIMSIKSWHNADLVWCEEANTVSKKSLEILLPTIRKPGSRIIFTMNRHSRSDAVDEMFIKPKIPPAGARVVKVGWRDNPWFTDELEQDRIRCQEYEPDRYPHIWEGEPDDSPDGAVVLPYSWLVACVDAHIKAGIEIVGPSHAGLDAADDGKDPWGYCRRRGPLICESWERKGEAHDVVPMAHMSSIMGGTTRLYYDAIGVGAAVKSEYRSIQHSYGVKPYRASDPVHGPTTAIVKGVKNKDFFARYNAQSWWNLRLRVINTRRLLRGENVKPEKCLFIDSKIDGLDNLILQLSQAVYDRDGSNRIKINKAPDDAASPNRADAAVMAFAHDCRRGLKQI